MSDKPDSLASDMQNAMRGVCMGCADVVPGVSGGTVALIFGIYERLVTAISHIDRTAIQHVRQGEWKQLVQHIDLRFLVTLASGLLSGVIGTTLVISVLLGNETTRSLTFAVFFGAIASSSILVAKLIRTTSRSQTIRCLMLGVIGTIFAYWVSTLQNGGAAESPSYLYVFLCGCIAICAMILPGISGAMILLVLGIYEHLTEIPHNLLAGKHVTEGVLTILVFGVGCLVSLIMFSKFLRWLLTLHYATTMALLCGFMLGALRKLWPFQEDATPEIVKFKEKTFTAYLPDQVDGDVLLVITAALVSAGVVLAVERWTRRA